MVVKSLNKERMKENMEIFDWELSEEDRVKISQIPQCKMISTYSLLSPQEVKSTSGKKGVKLSAVFFPGDAQRLQQGHGARHGCRDPLSPPLSRLHARKGVNGANDWTGGGGEAPVLPAVMRASWENVSCSTSSSSCGRRCWQTCSRRGSCAGGDLLLLPRVCSSEEKEEAAEVLCPFVLTSPPWLSP
ncbi:hypothetical protein GW17_00002815 [Ensete ventricosum]|nr:hypothetical protein GW17_00002815 [Ensete ventricosum]